MPSKKKPKFDGEIDGLRVRVYSTRSDYEVIFGDEDIEDPEAYVLSYWKGLGPPDVIARQGRLEYNP